MMACKWFGVGGEHRAKCVISPKKVCCINKQKNNPSE